MVQLNGAIEVAAVPGNALRKWRLLKGNQRLVAN
jgi:predicted transcriptional regulator